MNTEALTPIRIGWEALEREPRLLQTGDIIQMQRDTRFSPFVRFFTSGLVERRRTWASHTGMVMPCPKRVMIIESVWRTRLQPLVKRRDTPALVVAHRYPGGLTAAQQEAVARRAAEYRGRPYGVFKALMHFLDGILGGMYLFRRFIGKKARYPICSFLVATAYWKVLGVKFGIEPEAAAPDDILDYCVDEGWELVWASSEEAVESLRRVYGGRMR